MYNIDYYIEQAANMINTSDGGSPAFHFEDVCLIKYQGQIKYGRTRESAELIAQKANEKRAKGVRTPAHLGIKRVISGEDEICWVLQEKAKGQNFNKYCNNENNQTQISMQSRLANIPNAHYEKFVSDVSELFNLGIELKPKNIFYNDNLQNGGFTIIDLLNVSGDSFDSNSLSDVLDLWKNMDGISEYSRISSYSREANENEKELSKQLSFKIKQKMFSGMEKTIPNFDQHRRWVLRSMDNDVLDFFVQNGTNIGDLSLNEQEYKQFNQTIKKIVDNSIRKIEDGTHKYWNIRVNEIRNNLSKFGMFSSWRYHEANIRNINEFSDDYQSYEYNSACNKDLELIVNQMFNRRLDVLSKDSSNPFVLEAKNDLDAERIKHSNEPHMINNDELSLLGQEEQEVFSEDIYSIRRSK